MNMKKIFRALAEQHGVSVSEVKRNMQAAIDEAYKNPNLKALSVPKKGAVPTIEEFIDYNAKVVATQRHKSED